MLALSDQRLDMLMRFGVFIPMLVVGLVLTYTRFFGRIWEWVSRRHRIGDAPVLGVLRLACARRLPLEYGYVGVILITAFTYTLLQLRFVFVALVTVIGIATYLPYAFTARYIVDVSLVLTVLYLVSFGMLGGLAAYRSERFTRQLFLSARQLDQERTRSDGLLLNMLPEAIVEQLKTSSGGRIAQSFEHVSVFFADAVGSTEQAARSTPEAFADALDALFRHFDVIADRHGLEKIKTIGDAYMAVAGAPTPVTDHADAAVGDGGRHPRRRRDDQVAVGRPDRGARRDRLGAGRRRGHRRPEVRVRPVGRHGEPRRQARGERGARPHLGLRVDGK